MNYPQPVKGKLLIKKDEPKQVTAGGILLRANDRAKSFTGVAVTGDLAGQKVIFIPRVSSTINFRGENLVVLADDDILATYED